MQISDLDMNNHVNNTRYVKWILDSIPIEYHNTMKVNEFEINFLNETFQVKRFCFLPQIRIAWKVKLKHFLKGENTNNKKTVFLARLVAQMNNNSRSLIFFAFFISLPVLKVKYL